MNLDSVSVIIPAHNAQDTLADLLTSLKEQTTLPDEIIVVDDASTDRTTQIAKKFGVTTLTLKQNIGPGPARNKGAQIAKSNWLCFIDADCIAPPIWIRRALDFVKAHQCLATTGGYEGPYLADPCSWFQHWEKKRREPTNVCTVSATNGHNLMIQKKLYFECGQMPDIRTSEDFLFGRRITQKTPLFFDPVNGVIHRFRPQLRGYLKQKFHFAKNTLVSMKLAPLKNPPKATFSTHQTMVELGLGVLMIPALFVFPPIGLLLWATRALPFLISIRRFHKLTPQIPYALLWLPLRDYATLAGIFLTLSNRARTVEKRQSET